MAEDPTTWARAWDMAIAKGEQHRVSRPEDPVPVPSTGARKPLCGHHGDTMKPVEGGLLCPDCFPECFGWDGDHVAVAYVVPGQDGLKSVMLKRGERFGVDNATSVRVMVCTSLTMAVAFFAGQLADYEVTPAPAPAPARIVPETIPQGVPGGGGGIENRCRLGSDICALYGKDHTH